MSIQTLSTMFANVGGSAGCPSARPNPPARGLVDLLKQLIAQAIARITSAPTTQQEIDTVLHNLLIFATPSEGQCDGDCGHVIYKNPADQYELILKDAVLYAKRADGEEFELVKFDSSQPLQQVQANIAEQLTPAFYRGCNPSEVAVLLGAQMAPGVWDLMTASAKSDVDSQLVPSFFQSLNSKELELLLKRMQVPSVWNSLSLATRLWAEKEPEMRRVEGKLKEAEQNGHSTEIDAIPPLGDITAAERVRMANDRWLVSGTAVTCAIPTGRKLGKNLQFIDRLGGPELRHARSNLRRSIPMVKSVGMVESVGQLVGGIAAAFEEGVAMNRISAALGEGVVEKCGKSSLFEYDPNFWRNSK